MLGCEQAASAVDGRPCRVVEGAGGVWGDAHGGLGRQARGGHVVVQVVLQALAVGGKGGLLDSGAARVDLDTPVVLSNTGQTVGTTG